MNANFLFFDIDGVLLDPKGYRKATIDTIKDIGTRLGMRILTISEIELAAFESQGITSEWDMIPLYLLAWIETCFNDSPKQLKIIDHYNLAQFLGSFDQTNINPINIINLFGDYLKPGKSPAESIKDELLNGNHEKCLPMLFQFAPWLVYELLAFTRDSIKSETTRLFQNRVLGSDLFEEICGISPEIITHSYLLKHDKRMLDDDYKEKLIKNFDQEKIFICAMTARPSLGLEIFSELNDESKYFPEAELAINKIGLDSIPLVGYGLLDQIGKKLGLCGDYFLKPSPVHAITALALACNIEIGKIFEFIKLNKTRFISNSYFGLNLKSFLPDWLSEKVIYLNIFEDSTIGIRSVKILNEILIANGYRTKFFPFGISREAQKIEALKKENAQIFQDINGALSFYFNNNI